MKMCGFTSVFVLLLAGAAEAVNTVAPLNGPSQQALVRHVEPAGAMGQSLDASGSPDGVLQPVLEAYPDLSSTQPGDLTASVVQGGEGLAEPSAGGLIDGLNRTTDWATGQHWSTDPRKYADAGFVDASSRVDLPAFAEIDWVEAPLPTVKKASLMEILVFPALGAIVVIFVMAVLIVRLRRRRALSQAEQLLHA